MPERIYINPGLFEAVPELANREEPIDIEYLSPEGVEKAMKYAMDWITNGVGGDTSKSAKLCFAAFLLTQKEGNG